MLNWNMPWEIIEEKHFKKKVSVFQPESVQAVEEALAELQSREGGKPLSEQEVQDFAGRHYVWHNYKRVLLGVYESHSVISNSELRLVMKKMPLKQYSFANKVIQVLHRDRKLSRKLL